MPLWTLYEKGRAWLEIYRTAAVAEQKAANTIAARKARRARLQQMLSGSGGHQGRGRRR